MIRLTRSFVIMAILLLVPGLRSVSAQIAAVGSIRGVVTDQQGAVVPDVKVTASSADLPPVTTATDARGAYRLLNLEPGSYAVVAERAGLARYSQPGVAVRAGLNIALDIVMSVGSMEQTLEVKADTPMLEVERPVQSVNISGEFQRRLPISARRDWSDFLQLTPGLTSLPLRGSNGSQIYALRGGSFSGHVFQLDGADIGSFRQGMNTYTQFSTEALQDVQVKTGGIDAASPLGFGVVVNVATVSGTNKFKGAVGAVYTPVSWNDSNSPGGTAAINDIFQPDLSLGGPILKDRLWFFGAYRYTRNNVGISRTAKQLSDLTALVPGFEPFSNENRLHYHYYKLSGKIGSKHDYHAFYQRERNSDQNNSATLARPLSVLSFGGEAYGGRFSSVLGSSTTVRVSGSYNNKSLNPSASIFEAHQGDGPGITVYNSSSPSSGVRFGSGRLATLGNNLAFRVLSPASKTTLQADVTHFLSGAIGTHEFQAGVFLQPRLRWTNKELYANGGFAQEEVVLREPGNPAGGYIPFYRLIFDRPEATTAEVDASDYAFYLQDNWKPTARFTVSAGVRIDRIESRDGVLDVVTLKSTEIGPRLGAIYSLTKDNKNILRANWARVHALPSALSLRGTSSTAAATTELWDVDLNGSFETTRVTPGFTRASATRQIDPDFHLPFVNEWIVGYQRQLPGQAIVGASFVRRSYRDSPALLAVNGIFDGGVFRGYRDETVNEIFRITNNEWNWPVYSGFEVLATKRTNRIQLIGTYTRAFRHLEGTWQPNDPASFIQPDAFPNDRGIISVGGNQTSSYDANAPDSHAWQDHVFRAGVTYFAPWKLVLASSFSIQSGPYSGPIITRAAASDPRFGPTSVTLSNGRVVTNPLATTLRFAEATRGEGQFTAPAVKVWNVRVGRDFAVGDGRLELAFDVFNVLNDGTFTEFPDFGGNLTFDSNFARRPDGTFNGITRQFARAGQLSVRYAF